MPRPWPNYLQALTPAHVEKLRFGAPQFFLELIITPEGQSEEMIYTEGWPEPSEVKGDEQEPDQEAE